DDFTNAVAVAVGDENVAAGVHGHASRRGNPGQGGRPAVASVGRAAVAGDGDDVAGRLDDFPDAAVVQVGDEDVAASVHGHAGRRVVRGGVRGPAVAAVARDAGAGDRDDVAGRLDDLADAAVVEIRDEHVPAGVHRHRPRLVQPGQVRRPAVAAVT